MSFDKIRNQARRLAPSDTEILDWLEKNIEGYGDSWICLKRARSRGVRVIRVNKAAYQDARPTIRKAIIDAIKNGL